MNDGRFSRTKMLLGEENFQRLEKSAVIVFGVGGVGGYTVEALVRAGVGHITVVDFDTVDITNLNRQINATSATVGRKKVDVVAERVGEINPECEVKALAEFVGKDNLEQFRLHEYDYVVDAVDNVTAKLALAQFCAQSQIPIISSMGTGNKLHPEKFQITDIYKTSVCPLARVMRNELKKRGVERLKVLFSDEKPLRTERPPASISFVPSVAGLMIGGEVIRELAKGVSGTCADSLNVL